VVLLAVAAVILIGVLAVAVGRGGELDPAEADYRPVDLDEVTSTDVALMRPPTALFGYHREATDAAFGQIARAISDREVEIATLRRQLAEQLPVRTSPALRADPAVRADPAMRPEPPPGHSFGAGPRPGATGPMTKAGPPARPPARLPAEPPAPPSAGTLWQAPQHPQAQAPASPLPSRPVSSWPPTATTKAGSLLPEPMPNSSMPHIPLTGQDQTQPSGPAGSAGAPGASLPSRPSVLHRELADRSGAPEPGAEADPWLVWQRRTEPPAAQDDAPPAAGPHPAGAHDPADAGAHDTAHDPGEQP
jgi:hypothetical protein